MPGVWNWAIAWTCLATTKQLIRTGMIASIRTLLKIREGGLVTAGIPCSSYVFIDRFTSQRSREAPLGDETKPHVASANTWLVSIWVHQSCTSRYVFMRMLSLRIACRTAMLFLLAAARHIYFFVEQPASSLLELDPYFAFVFRTLGALFPMYRSFLCLGFMISQFSLQSVVNLESIKCLCI